MKNLLLTISLLISVSIFSQQSSTADTTFYANGDTVIHTVTNSTAVFTYPVTTVSLVVKPKVNNPPPNQPPVISPIPSQSITLPINSVTLSAVASDPDGTISSYIWTQSSGPNQAVIVSPNTSSTSITGLIQGVYVFKLAVIDNKGLSANTSVNITVNPAVVIPTSIQGFASQVKGGDAYKDNAVHVTNLNSTGAGSLYEAMRSNRYIVFDVGGTIKNFRWDVGNSESGSYAFITIDGTTAPSPGITLDNGTRGGNTFGFEGSGNHDIIIKGIRAVNAKGGDNFHFHNGVYNVVVDHCTAYGAGDGNIDITTNTKNITVKDCIFGPGCQCNTNGSDRWAGNMLIAYGSGRITIYHSVFYSRTPTGVGERNPDVSNQNGNIPDPVACDFVNNVVYNWGRQKPDGTFGSGYGTCFDYGSYGNVRNNYYYTDKIESIPGNAVTESAYGEAKGTIYAGGNVSGNSGVNPNDKTAKVPYAIEAQYMVTEEDACTALNKILSNAGVRYNGQLVDAEEQRIINIIKLKHPGCQ